MKQILYPIVDPITTVLATDPNIIFHAVEQNVIQRALILCQGLEIKEEDLQLISDRQKETIPLAAKKTKITTKLSKEKL